MKPGPTHTQPGNHALLESPTVPVAAVPCCLGFVHSSIVMIQFVWRRNQSISRHVRKHHGSPTGAPSPDAWLHEDDDGGGDDDDGNQPEHLVSLLKKVLARINCFAVGGSHLLYPQSCWHQCNSSKKHEGASATPA